MNERDLIKKYLKKKGNTLKKLSALSGVHWVTICKMKNGADYLQSTWEKIRKIVAP